jgi:hypothetical protein
MSGRVATGSSTHVCALWRLGLQNLAVAPHAAPATHLRQDVDDADHLDVRTVLSRERPSDLQRRMPLIAAVIGDADRLRCCIHRMEPEWRDGDRAGHGPQGLARDAPGGKPRLPRAGPKRRLQACSFRQCARTSR